MKNKFFMSLAGGLLLLTGCTDLNVDVDSLYTKYPNNDIAVEAKMADVYYQLRGCFGRRYMEAQELSSDEYTAVSYGGGWYDNGAYAHPSLHAYTKDDATIDWMGELMSGCTKANTVIRDLTNDGADEKYIARARAMRAFFEFVMMDCWGDAPIMDHIVAKDEVLERSPRAKVAEFIESELKDIIPLLTDEVSANTYGKPTKWMAEALLVKLCINWRSIQQPLWISTTLLRPRMRNSTSASSIVTTSSTARSSTSAPCLIARSSPTTTAVRSRTSSMRCLTTPTRQRVCSTVVPSLGSRLRTRPRATMV